MGYWTEDPIERLEKKKDELVEKIPSDMQVPDLSLIDSEQASSGNGELLYVGGAYNFKNQPERLKYIGKCANWHQFAQIGKPGVWCELLDSDLHLIEKTTNT